MDNLTLLLNKFAANPEDPEINFAIALQYEAVGQTAAALSYFLRTAERTDSNLLAYECLLKIGLCFDRQGNRDNSTRGAWKHAICLLPTRPEAYFLLSRHYERRGDHVLGYMFAEQGLTFGKSDVSLRTKVEYPGRYGLVFQKAVSAWWWGKPAESRALFLDLWNNYELDEQHKNAAEANMKQLGMEYQPKTFTYDTGLKTDQMMDIVLQGTYTSDTDAIIDEYLKLPFVNRIIVSCWNDDPPFTFFSTRVKKVRSSPPLFTGTENRNMQIISSRNGLAEVETLLVAKMRSDQHYDAASMTRMWEYMKANMKGEEIFVAGTYPNLLFHPRDHVFWGWTKNVRKLFDCPLEINGVGDKIKIPKNVLWKYYHTFIRTETYLGAHYIANYDQKIFDYLLQPEMYLHDGAPKWDEAKKTSDHWTPLLFKPFPRHGIDLKWKRKGWDTYPYDLQYATGERWAPIWT